MMGPDLSLRVAQQEIDRRVEDAARAAECRRARSAGRSSALVADRAAVLRRAAVLLRQWADRLDPAPPRVQSNRSNACTGQ